MKTIMQSNEIFQARTLMAEGKSLKDTAQLMGKTQATVRRYLPEMAEQAVVLNKATTSSEKKSRKYATKADLIRILKRGGVPTIGLDKAPLETVEQLFRAATKMERN